MQVVPAKAWVVLLVLLICAGSLALGILLPGRAAANELKVSVVTVYGTEGRVELRIAWQWSAATRRRGFRVREELLSVSFDQQSMVFESEEAAMGIGATGELLRKLERAAGPDGSRRLFVIPEGENGSVQVRFRPVYPGADAAGATFRIHVVSAAAPDPVVMQEILISSL